MQTSPTVMQPSRDEIQREVENLRDIKRRSTLQGGPGVLILDPDLPTPGAQAAAAQQSYWAPSDDSSSDSHSHEDSLASDSASASDDPFHLFWVPANMHPEIDPAQFRAFLKEHACAPGEVGLGRSESVGSAALGRKKSMLSRQYRPSENDGVEDERVLPLRRNRSSLYASAGPQLTIKDLEKLDELAEEASQSRDPSKLRSVLRRSLSMNMAPSVVDDLDHAMPDPGEDADAPIIVPRPGQILRRAARTKIRKPGQTGEGAHRFNATRRGTGSKQDTPVPDPRSSSDLSTSDHSDAEPPLRLRALSNDSLDGAPRLVRPESYSAEAFIFDAYARDDVNEDEIKILSHPSTLQSLPQRPLSPPPPPASMEEPELIPPAAATPSVQPAAALPPLEHPLPQRASSLVTPAPVETPSRTPSPVTTVHSDSVSSHTRPEPRPIQTPTSLSSTSPVPQGPELRREKDKDKKGLFKWGGSEKKGKKEQREKEKEAGFFGSLFGSKKKQEESTAPTGLAHGQSGRETAVALLGVSKSSRGYAPPTSPQPLGVNNYSRYPIHVERAIYRLSHIKLANPRRALYEQVLISNLMFWYLGIINKTQQTQQQQQQQEGAAQRQVHVEQAPTVTGGVSVPASTKDREEEGEHTGTDKEREAQSLVAAPQAQAQGQALQQQSQNRRGSLTKAVPSSASTRRAEQPVRGPQYDMQHRAMEQEYGAAFSGGSGSRQPSGPPAGAGYATGPVPMQMSMSMSGVKQAAFPTSSSPSTADGGAPAQQEPPTPRSASPSRRSRSPPPRLPPASTSTLSSHSSSSPLSPHSSPIRYVPPQQSQAQAQSNPQGPPADARPPARSMSATVAPPLPAHALGGVRASGRKAISAHAALPPGARRPRTADSALARPGVAQGGEEEDVPLALWQQQQQQQQSLKQQARRR